MDRTPSIRKRNQHRTTSSISASRGRAQDEQTRSSGTTRACGHLRCKLRPQAQTTEIPERVFQDRSGALGTNFTIDTDRNGRDASKSGIEIPILRPQNSVNSCSTQAVRWSALNSLSPPKAPDGDARPTWAWRCGLPATDNQQPTTNNPGDCPLALECVFIPSSHIAWADIGCAKRPT